MASQELEVLIPAFGDIRGEEQLVVKWNPTAQACKAWPAREKKVAPAQEKKQGGIRHSGWQDLRTRRRQQRPGRKNSWKVSR